MALLYYIDGYNVIHHCSRLKHLAHREFEAARDELADRVARFCVATSHSAKIVFDGAGRDPSPPELGGLVPRLEVIYSTKRQTADAYIERCVYVATDRKGIVVVSADRGIRQLCQGLGTLVMAPDHFLTEIRQVVTNAQIELSHAHRTHRRYTVEDRLDAKALLRLEKLKKLLGG
jgi:predicted RNA-binding protein with PIN domain